MVAESAHVRACEVALTALYLRGGPHREHVLRRRWPALHSALRRKEATLESLAGCARQEGLSHEAVVLESPRVIDWAENLVESRKVVTAASESYPSRWLKTLSAGAPPALWRSGEALPCSPSAIAVVGSRQVTQTVRAFAKAVGRRAGANGMSLFSGNAIGCDLASMRGAASEGGRVIGILPHGIDRLERKGSGTEFWSVCAPDEEFSRATAMERNALIYAAAPFSVVIHARLREGGTWHGAVDAHRRKLTRLIVRKDAKEPGNLALIALGAIPLACAEDLPSALEVEGSQPFLFE